MSECNCGCRVRLNVQEDSPVSLQVLDGDTVRVGCADFLIRTDKDYNHLENKPSVNGVTLEGDKSLQDLGIDLDDFVTDDELATVATSGAYSDLTGKPTIGAATVTIQENGETVDSFSVNATENKTINLTVPTSAADVSALPDSTKYAASVTVSLDTSNYKITVTLKDQDGNTLGTSQVIDLPLENYQPKITSSNELDADLVDDSTSTNKFTTAGDISKLAGIEAGAEVNVQSDWSQTDASADDFIENKPTKTSDFTNDGEDGSSTYLEADETAYMTASIPYGECDSTSTSTAFTATVPGITELRDGVCVLLKNGVVTSAAGFTININGLGAKPSYSSMSAATADTTLFNVNYTMLFIYDSTRISGGCWVCYRGYNSDTNTIGYQLRTYSQSMPVTDKFYRYRLLFTSADNEHYVPANTSSSTNATSSRTVNQKPINPFGAIYYYGHTTAINAGSRPTTSYMWQQYSFVLGYSFNRTNAALTMSSYKPVYIKCAPQADGSAIIDADNPFVQALPTTEDGKIYIFLGIAYSETNVEMEMVHPVYYYKNGAVRIWTNAE